MKNKRIFVTLLTLLYASSLLACNKEAPIDDSTSSGETSTSQVDESTYKITISQVEHGTISVSKDIDIKAGETIELSNIPEEGYEFYYYLIDGERYDESSFVMPHHDVNISGAFGDGLFDITCEYNDLIYFEPSIDKDVHFGETVNIEYMPVSDYVLSYFLINEEKIYDDSFIMPMEDVTIKAVVEKAYVESDYYIDLLVEGREEFNTRSNWFFEYGEEGLNIKIIVKDHFIVDNPLTVADLGYRDNIEFIISPLENIHGLSAQKTINILVSVDGSYWFRKANSGSTFADSMYKQDYFDFSSTIHHYLDKEGFEGYVVELFLDYRLFGLDKDSAQLVICPSFRNTINYPYKTYWGFYQGFGCNEYLNISNYPLINKDGTLSQNPYLGGE